MTVGSHTLKRRLGRLESATDADQDRLAPVVNRAGPFEFRVISVSFDEPKKVDPCPECGWQPIHIKMELDDPRAPGTPPLPRRR